MVRVVITTGNLVTDDYSRDVAAIGRIDVVPMILEVMCRVTGLGFSAVARVTDDRWIACAVRDEIAFGLKPGGELQIETTICNEIRQHGRVVAIDHVAEDERFCGHPTPEMYGFQSYISVPIRLPDGRFFGTLCAIDPKPARVNRFETIGMFKLFADLIALHLDAQERVARTETALQDERQRTELQDQFIAVLGHDLRNPLSAIQTGAKTLLKMPLSSQAAHIASVVDRSAARMTGLIHDVLDFARSRLGGGLAVTRVLDADVETMIEEVIDRDADRTSGSHDPQRGGGQASGPLRPRANRAALVQPSGQRADARRSGQSRLGARAVHRQHVRAVGRQRGAADPAGHRRPVVPALCAGAHMDRIAAASDSVSTSRRRSLGLTAARWSSPPQ